MIVKLDFSLDAWLKDVEIEADSVEDAIDKLKSMDILDMLTENTGWVKDFEVKDIDTEIEAANYEIKVKKVAYDVYEDEISGFDNMDSVEQDAAIAKVKNSLPTTFTFTFEDVKDEMDLEDLIEDAIVDKIKDKAQVIWFDFEITKTF